MSSIDKRVQVSFAAIDPYLEVNIVSPKETRIGDRVQWGDGNRYPEYLLELYNSVPTLRTIIGGTADFVTGNDVLAARPINTRGDSPRDLVHDLALDMLTYGGFAIQVIRDFSGRVAEVYYCDIRHLRSDEDNEIFYYSEKWGKGVRKATIYPKFFPFTPEAWARLTDEERNRHASSIIYVKKTHTQTYPTPVYAAAVKACELERAIDDFHLNAIENSFTGSMLVNFNQGRPTDEQKEEIETAFTEKFSGHQNAGRIMFSWNDTRDTATTLQPVRVEDFGARYDALAKHSRQQIFTAFRAVPALFGLMNETTGFSEQEFDQAFKLYNKTRVQPIQRDIVDALEKAIPGVVTIVPFSLDSSNANVS